MLTDTDPVQQAKFDAKIRAMTPEQKLETIRRLNLLVVGMANLRMDRDYPNDTARERKLRLGALWIDKETMIRIWGWDPDERGR